MTFKKLPVKIAGAMLIAGIALTGCSANNDAPKDETKQTQAAVQVADKASVSKFFNDHYNTWVSSAKDADKLSQEVETALKDVLGDEGYVELTTSVEPLSGFAKIDKGKMKEIADKLEKINPTAKYYDFSQTTDHERAYVNMISIAYSSILQGITDYKIEVTVPEDKINIKDNTVVVPSSDLTFIFNGEKAENATDATGAQSTKLNYVDGTWKIDAADMMKQVEESMKAEQKPAE